MMRRSLHCLKPLDIQFQVAIIPIIEQSKTFQPSLDHEDARSDSLLYKQLNPQHLQARIPTLAHLTARTELILVIHIY